MGEKYQMDITFFEKVCEIRETRDVKEVAQLLSTGEWVGLCATTTEPFLFSLAKIRKKATAFLTDT